MRNMPIDLANLAFVCVSPPRPKLVSQETGEVKVDKNGEAVYQVGLSCANESGRVDLLTVAVAGDPGVSLGQVVTPVGLVGFFWEQTINGERRSGVSFRAERVVPVGGETAAAA
ncbi:hypothetical protein GCM10010191_66480 [Actinomadura vinacea]|uniref:Regulatory protein n=2 Tax=Actinomadura vinacea TaxID=115336 RepID=A0ABN3JV21_9ACTN